jgi:hypothetical protein
MIASIIHNLIQNYLRKILVIVAGRNLLFANCTSKRLGKTIGKPEADLKGNNCRAKYAAFAKKPEEGMVPSQTLFVAVQKRSLCCNHTKFWNRLGEKWRLQTEFEVKPLRKLQQLIEGESYAFQPCIPVLACQCRRS